MASSINASTTTGLVSTADLSGILNLQSNGVTVATINSTGIVMASNTAPAFSAYQSVQQTGVTANTWTKVNLDIEVFDTNSNFASSRFTPTIAGYYQINGTVTLTGGNSAYYVQAGIYKNGVSQTSGSTVLGNGAFYPQSTCGIVVYLNGSTDYVELYTFGSAGGSFSVYNALTNTNFSGCFVRST